jgi:4-hydroxybenzoate polyprenyltransferase
VICVTLAFSTPASATSILYSNLNVNVPNAMATASRPEPPGGLEIESADDFILNFGASITSASFIGLVPAGFNVNDITDRKFDGHVERTRFRPLASGQIGSTHAFVFLAVELALVVSLLLFLTPTTRLIAIGVLPLVLIYPFCKRFTHWPQAVLGAAFNWGMLMAWAEVAGHIPPAAVLMWAGAIAWQIGYDTVYAYVDVKDDSRLGLRSTAILFGGHGKICIGLFYALTVAAWSMGGWMLGISWPYATGMLVIAAHLVWQTWRIDLARPELNFRLFLANILTGGLLACTALIGTW